MPKIKILPGAPNKPRDIQTNDAETRPLGAQISHMLRDRGVNVIFGIPGVHNQEMYRGIEEAGITHVLARHEQGAGFMADGYARATGKPGVAYVITGPGLCNIMTPMGQAYSDSVPMLVISSCLDETSGIQGQLHQMKDQRGAAACVADWSEEARTPQAAYALIDRAFAEFRTGRPRPKHIQVPISVLEAHAPPPPPPPWTRAYNGIARESELLEVKGKLERARAPLMILGGGLVGGGDRAVAVADHVGAALFTTYAGRGLVPDDHPRYFGATLARPESAEVLAKADLVMIVGSEMAPVDLWRDDLGYDGPIIRVDLDTASLADGLQAEHLYQYEACVFMAMLSGVTEGCTPAVKWRPKEVASTRARWRAQVMAERPGIVEMADAIREVTSPDTVIYSDMTQFAYAAKEIWPMQKAHHWHHPTGFGTLGYALPAAIGGAIARPFPRSTMAIIGDYGFHYTMQELGVAVELGLRMAIILWDNAKLGEIEASMVSAQIAPNAVVAHNPDFVKLAEAFGAKGVAPQSISDMQDAVKTALFEADGPTLIYLTPDVLNQEIPPPKK